MSSIEVSDAIHQLALQNIYTNLVTALGNFLCMPVTTASCERSFSKLKLVKFYLGSLLGQERLSNISIAH